MESFSFSPLGDSALVVELGRTIDTTTHRRVKTLADYLDTCPLPGIVECVPAYTTVTIFYDPSRLHASIPYEENVSSRLIPTPYEYVRSEIEQIISQLQDTDPGAAREIEIPVCYGGELGPDLEYVAELHKLTLEEVIAIHSQADYLVFMLGFAPGFPYLGGMPERIATPRRTRPRLSVPPGTVGIGGAQTGIYSIETPGGWQLIGRTPLVLFRPQNDPPTLLQAGDKVVFRPISLDEYKTFAESSS